MRNDHFISKKKKKVYTTRVCLSAVLGAEHTTCKIRKWIHYSEGSDVYMNA